MFPYVTQTPSHTLKLKIKKRVDKESLILFDIADVIL